MGLLESFRAFTPTRSQDRVVIDTSDMLGILKKCAQSVPAPSRSIARRRFMSELVCTRQAVTVDCSTGALLGSFPAVLA